MLKCFYLFRTRRWSRRRGRAKRRGDLRPLVSDWPLRQWGGAVQTTSLSFSSLLLSESITHTHTHTLPFRIFSVEHRDTHECMRLEVVDGAEMKMWFIIENFFFFFFQSRAFENTVSKISIYAVWQQILNNKLLYSLTISVSSLNSCACASMFVNGS